MSALSKLFNERTPSQKLTISLIGLKEQNSRINFHIGEKRLKKTEAHFLRKFGPRFLNVYWFKHCRNENHNEKVPKIKTD